MSNNLYECDRLIPIETPPEEDMNTDVTQLDEVKYEIKEEVLEPSETYEEVVKHDYEIVNSLGNLDDNHGGPSSFGLLEPVGKLSNFLYY